MPTDLEEEREEWRRLRWDAAATQRSWSEDLATAIGAYFERGGPMIERATLVSVGTATVGEVPVVEVVYQHRYHARGPGGLRLRLDEPPLGTLGIGEGSTVLDLFVSIVCYYVIGDPPGAAQDAHIQDDAGVWWHGYGFTEPELGEPGYDDRPSRGVHRLTHLLGLRPRVRGAPRRS